MVACCLAGAWTSGGPGLSAALPRRPPAAPRPAASFSVGGRVQTASWQLNPLCQAAKSNEFYWRHYMRCKDYCAWEPVRTGGTDQAAGGSRAGTPAPVRRRLAAAPPALPPVLPTCAEQRAAPTAAAALPQWNGALGAEASVTVLVVRMSWNWDWLKSPVPACDPV